MSKTYKGDVTGNVVELNLLDANEGTLPNLGTPTVVTKSTGPNVVEQFVGDIPANQYVAGSNGGYSVKGLVLGTSCTIINTSAFDSCFNLTGNLVIPDSVTSIGDYAFFTCNSLTGDLTIPDSVTSIGGGAFRQCFSFDGSLTIGNSVTSIGSSAFYNCNGLTGSLVIPNSVTSIGSKAFESCDGLNGSLTIGNSVTNIGNYAFSYLYQLTGDLVIPDSVTTIGSNAFYDLGNDTINIAYVGCPASSFTGSNAFGTLMVSGITTLYAKDAVANGYTLGAQTFQGASLTIANWTNYPNIP